MSDRETFLDAIQRGNVDLLRTLSAGSHELRLRPAQ